MSHTYLVRRIPTYREKDASSQQFSVNVWVDLVNDMLIDPHFFQHICFSIIQLLHIFVNKSLTI